MFSIKMKWVTLKSLFKGPDTRRFPAVVREPFAGTRGNLVFVPGKCTVCTLCEKRCPTNAIKVDRKARTWALDRHLCILCGECVDACNKSALRMDEHYFVPVLDKAKGMEFYDVPAPPAPPAAAAAPAAEPSMPPVS
jgi:ech hydrogenase subunit F